MIILKPYQASNLSVFQITVLVKKKKPKKHKALKTKGPKSAFLHIQNINHEQSKPRACSSKTRL